MARRNAKRTEKLVSRMAQEQFEGRLKCFLRKGYEINQLCDSDVYIVIHRQGRYYTYTSETNKTWPPSEQTIKDSADGDHRTPDTYKTASPRRHSLALESCWENAAIINGLVSPINERLERHTRIANLQPQELDLDKAMPIYESVQPYYEPYIATTPELVDDFFPFYQSTDIQCLDQDAWTQSGLIFPADERGGVVDCTPSKAQPQIRSSEEGRKPLGVETTSKDQEHDEDAGMNHTISHKRKFQTPEESGEDIGLDKRRKISHQNIHLDSKSYLEPAHFSPKADGADCTRNESHDLADVRAWLLDGRNVSIFEAESPDPAAIRAGLEDGRNVDFIEEKSPDLAETRA